MDHDIYMFLKPANSDKENGVTNDNIKKKCACTNFKKQNYSFFHFETSRLKKRRRKKAFLSCRDVRPPPHSVLSGYEFLFLYVLP